MWNNENVWTCGLKARSTQVAPFGSFGMLTGLPFRPTSFTWRCNWSRAMAEAAAAPALVVDHLVWCVDSVAKGIEKFEALTGVRPCIGGQHLGLGTHNALLSLGDGVYLEILALDPAQKMEARWIGIDCPTKPCLATYCVQADGKLEDVQASAKAKGYDIGSIKDYSRENTEGKTLKWRLAADHHTSGYEKLPFRGLVPFIVDWSVNPLEHPSAISPKGCRLAELRAYHPNPEELRKVFEALNLKGITVEAGDTERLEAILDSPNGQVKIWDLTRWQDLTRSEALRKKRHSNFAASRPVQRVERIPSERPLHQLIELVVFVVVCTLPSEKS